MKAGPSIGRNAGYNLAGSLIPLLLSLLTVPLYLGLIGADRYGVLAIAWLLLGYFGLFDLGLGRATSYRIAALRDAPAEERAATLWSAIAVNLAMGVVGALALWAAADWFFGNVFKVDERLRPEIVAAVPLLALAVPVATLSGVLIGALQGREQFLWTNTVSVTSTILFQLLPLGVAWLWGPDLTRLLAAALAARLVAIVVLGCLCHADLTRGHRPRVEAERFKDLLRFGGWVSVTSLCAPLLMIVDRFLIGTVLGAVAVTIYTIPFQLAQRFSIIPTAVAHAIFPSLSSRLPNEQHALGEKASGVLLCLMTPLVIVGIFGFGPFLSWWIGESFSERAATIAQVILLGFWFNSLGTIKFIRIQAMGRPDLAAKVHAGQVIPYWCGLWFAAVNLGLVGCAITFVARSFVEFIALSVILEKKIDRLFAISCSLFILICSTLATRLLLSFSLYWFASFGALLFLAIVIGVATLPSDVRDGAMNTFRSRIRGS